MHELPCNSTDYGFSETASDLSFPAVPKTEKSFSQSATESPFPGAGGLGRRVPFARSHSARFHGCCAVDVRDHGLDARRVECLRTRSIAFSIHRPVRQIHCGSVRPLCRPGALDPCRP